MHNLASLLDFLLEAKASIFVRHYSTPIPFDVVQVDDIALVYFAEKPMATHFMNAGIYVRSLECVGPRPS